MPRSREARSGSCRRSPRPIPRREPSRRPADHREVPHRPGREAARKPATSSSWGRARRHVAAEASWPTARNGIRRGAALCWSRTRPASRRSRAAIVGSRRSSRSGGSCSTSRRHASTRSSPVKRPPAHHRARRRDRPGFDIAAPLSPDHHHDRRGRRRRALFGPLTFFYRHMPPGHRERVSLHRAAPALPGEHGQGHKVRPDRRTRPDHQGLQRQEPVRSSASRAS